jgi:hypothetical protein
MLPYEQKTVVYPIDNNRNHAPYRSIIHDDDGEGPGYKPTDPALPVGDTPSLLIFLLIIVYCIIKHRKEIET